MKKTLLSMLAVAILLSGWSTALAQTPPAAGLKPLVTVSFSGYDELIGDIGFLGNLAGNPEMAKGIEGILVLVTQGKGLAGLDKSKPWGLVVQTDGEQFPIVAFVPVTDLKQLLDALAPHIGQPEDAGDGLLKLQPGGNVAEEDADAPMGPLEQPIFVKEQGGWAFISNSPEAIAAAPADPIQALGGLQDKYDLAVKATLSNVPAPMRQMFTMQLQAGSQMLTGKKPNESDEDYAIRAGVTKKALEQFISTINDLDEVLLGWALDQSTGTTYLDFEVTAVEGSKTAAIFAEMAETTTALAGFDLPGAAMTANWAGTLSDADLSQLKSTIGKIRTTAVADLPNQGLSAEDALVAAKLITDLLDVVEKTAEGKKVDFGAVLLLDPDAATFVAGGVIAEGAKLESTIKELVKLVLKDNPDAAAEFSLKMDAETHAGVRFHTLALPVPQHEEPAVKIFGETLDVVLGIGDSSVYVAVGSNAAETLKSVIDKSQAEPGKQVPPMQISLSGTPIAKFIAATAPDDDPSKMMATMMAGELEKSGGKDHLSITAKSIPGGVGLRLEIEGGLLKLIALAGQMAQQQMMGGGGDPPPAGAPF